ncbi:Hypothetical protein I5071_52540 [Sandaracinus amylolyticus]|nr:Hypothetical protein I5071_52540 [Sandaracinus amylolyticus]
MVWLFGEWHAAVAVGPEVDLADQCRSFLAAERPETRCSHDGHPFHEMARRVREQTFCPELLAVVALEREHPELAFQIATTVAEEMAEHERFLASAEVVESDDVAAEWLAFGPLNRALLAHMQGDDCLALQVLRLYESIDQAPRQRARGGLATVRALRADQERRALVPRSIVPDVPPDGPVRADIVPALIASLDEVDGLQLGQPGGVSLGAETQVTALIRAGTSAVPFLIDAIEHDARLTRSVQFFRDFGRDRRIVSVRDVAMYVLEEIVGASFPIDVEVYELDSAQSWSRFAAHLRAWWAQAAGGPIERSLAMLREDGLDPGAWADAAIWIRGNYYGWRAPGTHSSERRRTDEARRDVAGEAQLGGLAMRRAEDALRLGAPVEACSLARAAWNADPSVGSGLAAFARRCAGVAACPCLDDLAASLGPFIPAILDALDAYQPAETDHPLRVLSRAPDHPAVARLAERVFARPPFAPSRSPSPPTALVLQYLRDRRLAAIPALRALVLRALRDRRVVGRVAVDEGARVETTRAAAEWVWGRVMLADGGTYRVQLRQRERDIQARVCDLWADALDPANTFWVDDDEAARDEWIRDLAQSIADADDREIAP